MKATVLVLKISPWKLDNGMEGVSLVYLMDNHKVERSTITPEMQEVFSKCPTPALFELDIDVSAKTFNNVTTIKYKVNGAKFIKEVKIF